MKKPKRVTLAVRNLSTVVPDADVVEAFEAFEHQVNVDLARYWRRAKRVKLRLLASKDKNVPKGEWLAEIYDNAEQARSLGVRNIPLDDPGHHKLLQPGGRYYMIVLAQASEEMSCSWTVTFSHELLESLVDPTCDQEFGTSACSLELCDPVWMHAYPITPANVWVSNFVTPNWYRPGADGVYDFMGNLGAPIEVPLYGYFTTQFEGKSETWQLTPTGWVKVPQEPDSSVGKGRLRPRPQLRRTRRRYFAGSR